MEKLIFTVTNDLTYDQRMIRICSSLSKAGYHVTVVGRKLKDSVPLQPAPFYQERLNCFASKGFLLYAEYNLRLLLFLLQRRFDLVCCIDLDTILPGLLASVLRNKKRVYDAHELFCEMKEIVSRPRIYRVWKFIERRTVPRFQHGYTVNDVIAREFEKMYAVHYEVVRNLPVLRPLQIPAKTERFILYQGAVNEGRCFENLIPAMKTVNARLVICGDGNFMEKARQLCIDNQLSGKVEFVGKVAPSSLLTFTHGAYIGITLFDNVGESNYYSLANRFFDYMHAAVPQVCVDFPLYRAIIEQHEFALLVADTSPEGIAASLNKLLSDDDLYLRLQQNCVAAREQLNWQLEEIKLISFYRQLFSKSG